jgi:predicted DNA-binding protein
MAADTTYKTSVNLPQVSVDALKELAEKSGSSMAEVLRRAISTEKFLNDTVEKGGKILIDDGKSQKQLLIRK